MDDDFLEGAYEERYEGEDYNVWEEQQVFLDGLAERAEAEAEGEQAEAEACREPSCNLHYPPAWGEYRPAFRAVRTDSGGTAR